MHDEAVSNPCVPYATLEPAAMNLRGPKRHLEPADPFVNGLSQKNKLSHWIHSCPKHRPAHPYTEILATPNQHGLIWNDNQTHKNHECVEGGVFLSPGLHTYIICK